MAWLELLESEKTVKACMEMAAVDLEEPGLLETLRQNSNEPRLIDAVAERMGSYGGGVGETKSFRTNHIKACVGTEAMWQAGLSLMSPKRDKTGDPPPHVPPCLTLLTAQSEALKKFKLSQCEISTAVLSTLCAQVLSVSLQARLTGGEGGGVAVHAKAGKICLRMQGAGYSVEAPTPNPKPKPKPNPNTTPDPNHNLPRSPHRISIRSAWLWWLRR